MKKPAFKRPQIQAPHLPLPHLSLRRRQVAQQSEGEAPCIVSDAFIVCDGLVKIYKVADLETVALQGLELEVRRGEILGIVGNSGSGKTTLVNIIGGLDRPSAGRIYVGGQNLLELADSELSRYRREKLGFVWQQSARNLIPYLSALENVQLPMIVAGLTNSQRQARARRLLSAVGLEARMHHHPAEMSGGEQQRVAIAVAMANSPEILLADEPTGEVDTETAKAIYDIFHEVNREYGTTIIIVSHDRNIAHYVDRVVAVRDGKVSTETVRRQTPVEDRKSEMNLQELVVLDAAGRLQLPLDLVQRFGIKGRVRVEAEGDHIVILPADSDGRGPIK